MTRLLAVAVGLLSLVVNVQCLWPNPRSVSYGSENIKVASWLAINAPRGAPSDLNAAIDNMRSQVFSDNMAQIPGSQPSTQSLLFSKELSTLNLVLKKGPVLSIADETTKAIEERDESYTLSIPSNGTAATLEANTTLGLFRGLTSFSLLSYSLDGNVYIPNAPIAIDDTPAYPYRGLLLDTSRNFFPVSTILRTLDAMSYVKINTFHWHVTDSQSFPIQVPDFMELSAQGAYSSSQTYSIQDVQNIMSYANSRGIDVLVEIDSPGHTGAIFPSHPDYVACYNERPWTTYANEPPAGQIRFMNTTVVSFMEGLFKAAAGLSTSTLFSTGGDELNTNCYVNDTASQAAMQETGRNFNDSLGYFVTQMHDTLRANGKTPVVWEEMLLQWDLPLGNDTIIITWISSADAAQVGELGFRMVHGPSDYFYLDCGAGEWIGTDQNPSWCDPFKSWQIAYSFNPLENLTESQYHLVLGGQQLLWTEQSGPENVDPIIWPRAAASAEVFWTGANGPDGSPRNSTEAITRLHDIRYRMVQRGINAINLQPEWCYKVGAEQCDLNY